MTTIRVPLTGGQEIRDCAYCGACGVVGESVEPINSKSYACGDIKQCQDRMDRSKPAAACVLLDVVTEPWDDGTGVQPGLFSVHPVWADVDRPDSGGWVVRGRPIARRLEAAIRAGAAVVPTGITTDRAGKTYVQTTSRVMAKYMNADLRKLGY